MQESGQEDGSQKLKRSRIEGAPVEYYNLARGWLASRKVGGQWRLGHQGRNEETGRERREKVDRKDDKENQKSQARSKSTVTGESVKVRKRSGGLVAQPGL